MPGPSEQPKRPTAHEPELPGDFVSEDLRADCLRFLEELRALIGRRAELLAASAGWVPEGRQSGSDHPSAGGPPTTNRGASVQQTRPGCREHRACQDHQPGAWAHDRLTETLEAGSEWLPSLPLRGAPPSIAQSGRGVASGPGSVTSAGAVGSPRTVG